MLTNEYLWADLEIMYSSANSFGLVSSLKSVWTLAQPLDKRGFRHPAFCPLAVSYQDIFEGHLS